MNQFSNDALDAREFAIAGALDTPICRAEERAQ
jgi:hypothetical protein